MNYSNLCIQNRESFPDPVPVVLPNLQDVKDTSQVINTGRQMGSYLFQVLRIWYNCDKPKNP
jgi:hypothetical protein